MNKKGQYDGGIISFDNIYFYFFIVVIILSLGIILATTGAVIKIVGDGVLPTLHEQVNSTVGESASTVVTGAMAINGAIPWVVGMLYIFALLSIVILAYAYRMNGHKYLMVLYFVLAIVVILLSIIISNVYQNFYEGSGDIGTELKDQELLSFLILYSPLIMTILLFIGAIIMFSGLGEVPI